MELEGTENGKPLHHFIDIMYSEIYKKEKTTLEIGMCHTRASDTIRISYDSDRDGWIIEQASIFEWSIEDVEKYGENELPRDRQEIAFIQAWSRQKNENQARLTTS